MLWNSQPIPYIIILVNLLKITCYHIIHSSHTQFLHLLQIMHIHMTLNFLIYNTYLLLIPTIITWWLVAPPIRLFHIQCMNPLNPKIVLFCCHCPYVFSNSSPIPFFNSSNPHTTSCLWSANLLPTNISWICVVVWTIPKKDSTYSLNCYRHLSWHDENLSLVLMELNN